MAAKLTNSCLMPLPPRPSPHPGCDAADRRSPRSSTNSSTIPPAAAPLLALKRRRLASLSSDKVCCASSLVVNRALLGTLTPVAVRDNLQPPPPQVAVLAKRSHDMLRALHQRFPQIAVPGL